MVGFVVLGICLIDFHAVIGQNYDDPPIVDLPLGKAAGIKIEAADGAYMAYRGIPYAKPPVGNRRFEPPEFYDIPWAGVRNFTEYRDSCIGLNHLTNYTDVDGQIGKRNYTVFGSEDCLYLNIHKGYQIQKSAPVVFFLHGGFFSYSDPQMYGHDYLASQNIIYVNIAYRVGPLGFLTIGTDDFSGNMGLKDQVLALNWVKVNIWRFGGNAGKITVAGIDAGAASAHFLFFSRSSSEMFNNAISYSGTAFSPWAMSKESTMFNRTKYLGAKLKCFGFTIGDYTIECLRSKPAKDIVLAQMAFKSFYYLPLSTFTPVDDSTYLNGYFLDNPTKMLMNGTQKKNDWMTGLTDENGLYPLAEFAAVDESIDVLLKRWYYIVPDLLIFNRICRTLSKVRALYYSFMPAKSVPSKIAKYKYLLSLVTDRYYRAPAFYSAQKMSERRVGNTFLYLYDFPAEFSRSGVFVKDPWKEHPFADYSSHGDDVFNIFSTPFYGIGRYERDYQVHQLLIEIMVTFAATSSPPAWLNWMPMNKDKPTIFREATNDDVKAIPLVREYRSAGFDEFFGYKDCQI